jgi:hypothetical protein
MTILESNQTGKTGDIALPVMKNEQDGLLQVEVVIHCPR